MIKEISCLGFRSFAQKQTLKLAAPNGNPGSGLTVLVGPNGGGKSTLVECFNKVSAKEKASFSKGKRNIAAGDKVEISILYDDKVSTLKTIRGGSQTQWIGNPPPKIYHLPSRRFFSPYFGMGRWDRNHYINTPANYQQRTSSLNNYTYRLIDLNAGDPTAFNAVMERILGHHFSWTIDQDDNSNYYVNILKARGVFHNSDGLGEGVLSLMFIVDALCGTDEELIVIDEPELSLHPQLQVRLMRELLEKTKNAQVVISTHSPNMLSLESIANGGNVARVHETYKGSVISMIDDDSRTFIRKIITNFNNPHILGTDARACFFAEDGLIITEGQEDVVLYPLILEKLGLAYDIPFFGFGAGGASGIEKIAHLLYMLGFKKVGAIYDGDKKTDYDKFVANYTSLGYKAWIIPADDIRDKEQQETHAKSGLLDKDRNNLNPGFDVALNTMFKDMDTYLKS